MSYTRMLLLFIFVLAMSLLPTHAEIDSSTIEQQFVNDNADIFTAAQETQLTQLLEFVEQNTSAEFAVVTIPSLDNQAIEVVSLEIAEHLGIGKQDVDNGLLLLIAPNDRAYRFEVGYGLEGAFPDGRVGDIGRNVLVPFFQQNQYYNGTYAAMQVAYGFVSEDPTIISAYQSTYDNQEEFSTVNIIALIIIIIILIILQSKGVYFIPFMGGGFGNSGGSFGSGNFGSGGFGGFGGGGFGGGGAGGGW